MCIYYDVPKCASSTIRQTLFGGDNRYSLRNPKHKLSEYFKFTFIRNPWDRMVSNWLMFHQQSFRVRQLRSMTDEDLTEFGRFVEFARRHPNHHWMPQSLFLPGPLDFVGRLEEFDEAFDYVCDRIGVDGARAETVNATARKGDYREAYTPELIDVVKRFYREDVDRFGYAF